MTLVLARDGALPSLALKDIRIDDNLVKDNERMLTDGFYAEVPPQQEFHHVGRDRVLTGVFPDQVLPDQVAVERDRTQLVQIIQ